jgi:Tfp pilus assembly protein PilO
MDDLRKEIIRLLNTTKTILRGLELWQYALVIMAVLLLFYFLSWNFVLKEKQKKMQESQRSFSSLNEQAINVGKEISMLANIKSEQINDINKRVADLEGYAAGQFNNVLKNFIAGIEANKLELTSVKNKPINVVKDGYYQSGISFSVKGTYDKLGEFLFYLKEQPVLYQFNSVILESRSDDGSIIEMVLDMDIYYR